MRILLLKIFILILNKVDWLILGGIANRQRNLGKVRSVLNQRINNIPFFGCLFKMVINVLIVYLEFLVNEWV